MIVAVIGGGAAGMMAALSAAEEGAEVILIERQARVGRKLLATGNGRCNLSNRSPLSGHYHGDDPAFPQAALAAFPVEATLQYFHKLGLLTVQETSGRVYPYSDQANSVVDVLRFALEHAKIIIKTGQEVEKIKKAENGFLLRLPEENIFCQRVIVACGGIAGSKLGGTMAGYRLLRSLGHSCTRLRPSLVQICSSYPKLPALKGIRAQCKIKILHDGQLFAQEQGEIQFTQQGISGPVVFDISRDVCSARGQWLCHLDFIPQQSAEDLLALLIARRTRLPALTVSDLFTGILHNRLGRIIAQEAGLALQDALVSLTESQLKEAAKLAKNFVLELTEPLGMDSAQVTAGGIRTAEFKPETLESRLVPGLFACGEVLDVDGDCGGYNLQWAWSSGRVAGQAAGKATP